MKLIRYLQILALAGTLAASPRAAAQGFGLSVTSSVSSVLVSNSVTFTVNLTNLTGNLLADAIVTNALPASAPVQSVQVLNAAANQVFATTNGSVVRFDLMQFQSGGSAQLTVTAQLLAAGFITNTVIATATILTNVVATNVVIQVTNPVVPVADLGAAIFGPAQAVITNDWMTYGVTATNAGPNAASDVMLTNTLPPGVILLSSPAHQGADSNMIFNLGTMIVGGSTNFLFTIQPTNAGNLTLSASIGSASILDTNLANNSVSTNIDVIAYLPGQLVAFTNSAQSTNFLNGLLEQSITLSNSGLSSVFAARVVVTGLTNRLFNAVGTNNSNPFVVYDTPPGLPLTNGQSVSLLLQYFPRKSFAFTNSQLQAFEVPVPNLAPPLTLGTSTNLTITRILTLANGNMLIEWPAITNRNYTVVYSDNVLFSNAMIAPPSFVAPANDVEWIDYGPPATVSAPSNGGTRFYRVLLNP